MTSQLGTLFTPGYDSTMQGLIGDENADQARGQQAMAQMQNQQLAQQELQVVGLKPMLSNLQLLTTSSLSLLCHKLVQTSLHTECF